MPIGGRSGFAPQHRPEADQPLVVGGEQDSLPSMAQAIGIPECRVLRITRRLTQVPQVMCCFVFLCGFDRSVRRPRFEELAAGRGGPRTSGPHIGGVFTCELFWRALALH
eukprot:scaffold59660_cov63-Phaeocystis_antarctica.AAC.1